MVSNNHSYLFKERGICPDMSLFLFASKKWREEKQAIARLKSCKDLEKIE